MLQISEPPSFVSNSLSVPFPQDRRQVLLDGHLLPVAAVAVGEDPVRVALGQGLRARVVQRLPSTARRKEEMRHVDAWSGLFTHTPSPPYI